MHFNIDLDDETGNRLTTLARQRGETRNALIRNALKDWVDSHVQSSGWPSVVMEFQGIPDMIPFEAHRESLSPPHDDPPENKCLDGRGKRLLYNIDNREFPATTLTASGATHVLP